MKIACPKCNAAYDVPPERLAPGRGVRCARCGDVWTPVATVDAVPEIVPLPETRVESAPEPVPEIEEAPVAEIAEAPVAAVAPELLAAEPVARPAKRAPIMAGWLVSLAVLAALSWLGVKYRAEVVHAWPPAERAYAAIGLRPE